MFFFVLFFVIQVKNKKRFGCFQVQLWLLLLTPSYLDGAGERKWSLAYVESEVGRAAEGYQLRRRQRGGHTQQEERGVDSGERRKGGTMQPKDPPKRRKSPENATQTRADDGG